MTDWPLTLPQRPQVTGFADTDATSTLRSSIGYGPQNQRQRNSVYQPRLNVVIRLTQAQVAELETFYKVTLGRVLPFNWIDFKTLLGACPPDSTPAPTVAQYRIVSPPVYTPLGGAGTWHAMFQLQGYGDSGVAQAQPPCSIVSPPTYVLADPITTEFRITFCQQPCDPIGPTYYDVAETTTGEFQYSWLDRDKDKTVFWRIGDTGTPSRMIIWDNVNNFAIANINFDDGVNNRVCGIGFSSQSDGVIDRYFFQYRSGGGFGSVAFYDDDGTYIGRQDYSGPTRVYTNIAETDTYIMLSWDTINWEAIDKQQTGDFTGFVYVQTATETGYSKLAWRMGIPDQAYVLQAWTKDSDGKLGLSQYIPDTLGGSSSSMVDIDLVVANHAFNGGVYDGTFCWWLFVRGGDGMVRLLKTNKNGTFLDIIDIPEITGIAVDGEVNRCIDFDPDSGFLAIQYSNTLYFFDRLLETTIASRSMPYAWNNPRFDGEICTAFMATVAYDFGSGDRTAVTEVCTVCPECD